MLTIQWACNVKGIKIPFDLVASEMSSTTNSVISAGAIIQHLAKFRVRMVQQGLSVPPPLTRGGNNSVAALKASQSSKTDGPVKVASTRRYTKQKTSKQDDYSEGETSEETDSGSEMATPKKPSAKTNGKRNANRPSRGGRTSKGNQQIDDTDSDVVKQEPASPTEDKDSQARYGVGDSMWSLDGIEEAAAKRVRTSVSSSQFSQSPTKVVVLDIGREGFAKLGVSGQAEDFEPRDDISDYQSENSEQSSNDDSSGNDSPVDRSSYGRVGVSETSANYHNPYGHNTFGSNQTNTLEDGHELGFVEHEGFEEDLLGHVTLYDQNRSNDSPVFNGLSPNVSSHSGAKSQGVQKNTLHGPHNSSDLATVDEHLSSHASTANPGNGIDKYGRLSDGTAAHHALREPSATSFHGGVTGVGEGFLNNTMPSSYSSYGDHHPSGGNLLSFPQISYGELPEEASQMPRNHDGLDYMASGAPFPHDNGMTWESFLDAESYGFGY